jgi:hypothetical protein
MEWGHVDRTNVESGTVPASTDGGRPDEGKGDVPPMATILWWIIAIILIFWLIGLIGSFGGSLIHLLLVVALILLIYNLITGRRAV